MEEIYIGRYKVVEEIGRGGMGVVYKGEDPTLERPIAIKVLPPKRLSIKKIIERFLKEAKLAARLDHPNIIRIYDIGKEEDTYHIVMEYVEGRSLSEIIREREEINVRETLEIFIQICEALRYAHSQKVIHRDIKPDNIMITKDNKIKVMDFGLACLEDRHSLTELGAVMGTIAYFSPEQAKGQPADHRCDIYSLGIVLFEMLTNNLPFEANNPSEMIQKHLTSPVPSVLKYNSQIPRQIDRIIRKMTMKNPELRYQDLSEPIKDIKDIFVKKEEVAVSSAIAEEKKKPEKYEKIVKKLEEEKEKFAKVAPEVKPYEAKVLCPHCQAENDPEKKYCSDCGGLLGASAKEAEAHHSQGLAYLEEGRYLEAEDEFRKAIEIDKELLQAYIDLSRAKIELAEYAEARKILSQVLEKNPQDVNIYFLLAEIDKKQDKPEDAIGRYLKIIKIDPRGQKAYLKLAFLYSQLNAFKEAIKHFQNVLSINPHNLEAYLQLGIIYASMDEADKSIEYFEKALGIDPSCEQALVWLGDLYLKKGKLLKSEEVYQRALDIYPENANLYAKLGTLYAIEKKSSLAQRELKQAVRIDPKNLPARKMLAQIYLKENKVSEAVSELEELLKYHPRDEEINYKLGQIYLKEDNLDKALHYFEKSADLNPQSAELHSKLGMIYFKKDYSDRSHKEYKKAVDLEPYNPSYREDLGVFYYWHNQKDRAIKEMENAVMLASDNVEYIKALGMMYEESGQFKKAENQFKKALKISPEDYIVIALLGKVYFKQNLVNLALNEYNKALKIKPDSYLLRIYAAKAYRKLGKPDLAIEEFKKALEGPHEVETKAKESLARAYSDLGKEFLDRGNFLKAISILEGAEKLSETAEILYYLGRAYFENSQYDKAVEKLKKAYAQEPGNYEVLGLLGKTYYKKGSLSRACSILEKTVKVAPWHIEYQELLAEIYESRKHYRSAVNVYNELLKINKEKPDLYLYLKGNCFYHLSKYSEALSAYQEAVKLKDNIWQYHDAIAKAQLKLGNKKEAKVFWETALKLGPDKETTEEINRNLRKLGNNIQ